jgi:bacterioferritin
MKLKSENFSDCAMKELNQSEAIRLLNAIMEAELLGVIRYTNYALMVKGPNRLTIVEFLKEQATESLLHAQQAGEVITGLAGHPITQVPQLTPLFQTSIYEILLASWHHEQMALDLYQQLLEAVTDSSVYLEEFARGMIGQEELHSMELKKMLRDFQPA